MNIGMSSPTVVMVQEKPNFIMTVLMSYDLASLRKTYFQT